MKNSTWLIFSVKLKSYKNRVIYKFNYCNTIAIIRKFSYFNYNLIINCAKVKKHEFWNRNKSAEFCTLTRDTIWTRALYIVRKPEENISIGMWKIECQKFVCKNCSNWLDFTFFQMSYFGRTEEKSGNCNFFS